MKRFVVIRWVEELNQDMRLTGADGNRYTVTKQLHESCMTESLSFMDRKGSVYYADSAYIAEQLCDTLARSQPGTAWMYAESAKIYQAPPGPVRVSSITSKGVLPV